jgi:hypothetical protein
MAFAHAHLDGRPAALPRPRMAVRSLRAGQVATGLESAWRADDAGDPGRARAARLEAAWQLRLALRAGEAVTGERGGDQALLAELLRRAGDFAGALAAAERGLAFASWHPLRALLHYQRRLALAADAGDHDLGEALA